MNLKKTAIALAVASIAAAPIVASADGSVYASARIGVALDDDGDGADSTMTIKGFASRMGIKGETDLGNGMTSWGKYEFSVGTEGAGTNVGRRHAVVGMKGDFGNVFLGQTYHTYYNNITGASDYPWWNNNDPFYVGRTAQALSYAGSFGAIGVGASVYMNDDSDEDMDRTELAVRGSFGDVGVGVGVISEETADDDQVGIAVEVPVGPVDLRGNFTTVGDDNGFHIYAGFGNAYLDVGSASIDATDATTMGITLGYTHNIGPRTLMWFEFNTYNADDDSDDDTLAIATFKYDIM